MKTLEEKAKAYDEALERAREWYNNPNSSSIGKSYLYAVFPELAERYDERIRKALISVLKSDFENDTTIHNISVGDIIAWLERQGEQKDIEPTPIFRIGDILKKKGKDYTFRVDRIQGGYYHSDHNHGAFFPIEEQGNWELVEQRSIEWSDEEKWTLSFLDMLVVESVDKKLITDVEAYGYRKFLEKVWRIGV